MSKPRDLETRVAALEAAAPPRRDRLMVLCVLLGLVGFALLMFQMRVLQRQWDALRGHERQQLFWTLCQPSASVSERTAAFRQLAMDGHREWRSAASQGLELRGSALDGADLQLADLSACDLRESSLVGANLVGVRLRTADLSEANLEDGILDGADCLRAILEKANFRKAQMRSCSLEQTQAAGASFVLADLSESMLLMADLSGADFTGANLTAATLESAKLRGATLALTNLSETNLINADLTDSNWWRARGLTEAQLMDLAAEFPPTGTADSGRVKDFQLWLESFAGGAEGESERSPAEGE